MIDPFKQNNYVFFVETENPHFNPLAIRPRMDGDHVSWEDTSRGTSVEVKQVVVENDQKLTVPPERVKLILKNEEEITLVFLTNQLFNQTVCKKVAGGGLLKFPSDEAVQKYFLDTNFNSY